ncbi:MAG: hypothetical protein IPJ65_29835 [Archangiaceae bacterium]|nr:hypothetical protein [Archangiaceae bacterium]
MRAPFIALLSLVVAACDPAIAPEDAGSNAGGRGGTAGGAATAGGSGGNSGGSGGGSAGGSTAGGSGGQSGGSTAGGSGGQSGGRAGGSAGGSTSGDAGTTDGGRAAFFGDSRCADAGFKLCEDFESGVINASTWTQTGAASLAVSTGDHARGTRALHITKTGNGSAYLRETKTFPATNNTYWGRAFYKFIALPVTTAAMTYSHWTIVGATGNVVNGEIRLSGQLSNGRNLFGVGTDNRTQDGGTGDWTNSDKDPNNMPRAVPLNEWMCLEWLHDGANDETRFYWDGVEHPSMHTTRTMHGGNSNPFILPQFTAVWVGWAEYQASTEPFEMWVDEIAIDSQRIGCVR